MRKLLVLMFVIWGSIVATVNGQDVVFSQAYLSGSALNPSLSGLFEGDYKLSFTYRDQWYSLVEENSYKTEYISFNYKLNPDNKNVFTIGGLILNDAAGESRFRQTIGLITGSYNMQLSKGRYGSMTNFLSLGFQLGIGQNSVQFDELWFGRQFDVNSLTIDTSLPSGEITREDYNAGPYPEVGVGLTYYGLLSRKFSLQTGFSLSHINAPSISNLGSTFDRKQRRLSIHSSASYLLNSDFSFIPSAIVHLQGQSYLIFIGSSFSYSLVHLGESGFRVGGHMRIANSVDKINFEGLIVSAMYERQNIKFGLSYDFTLSKLRFAANALGGFELSLSYISPGDSDLNTPRVPLF